MQNNYKSLNAFAEVINMNCLKIFATNKRYHFYWHLAFYLLSRNI